MTQPFHLVVAFAASASPAWAPTLRVLPPNTLRNLSLLLRGMKRVATSEGAATSLSTPHERVLAAAAGIATVATADGKIAWAAAEAARAGYPPGKAWAVITPCHWAMGREHATLTDPAGLALTADESQSLRTAMQPYFATDGMTLHDAGAGRWLAEGEVLRELPTASLDRVLGRNVDAWLPGTTTSACLRRLQNEMQMLLYTHPLNDARQARGQRSVNSFWISGSGALAQPLPTITGDGPTATVSAPRTLANAVFADDWAGYAAAWAALDASELAELLARQKAGQTVQLSLCGESHAQTFETAKIGFFAQISGVLRPKPWFSLLEQL